MGKTYYKQELIILVLKKFTYQNIIISKYIKISLQEHNFKQNVI